MGQLWGPLFSCKNQPFCVPFLHFLSFLQFLQFLPLFYNFTVFTVLQFLQFLQFVQSYSFVQIYSLSYKNVVCVACMLHFSDNVARITERWGLRHPSVSGQRPPHCTTS